MGGGEGWRPVVSPSAFPGMVVNPSAFPGMVMRPSVPRREAAWASRIRKIMISKIQIPEKNFPQKPLSNVKFITKIDF